jgi:hypothetical protein
VPNLFWTDNVFMNHRYLLELRELPEAFQTHELQGPPLAFYTRAESASMAQIREAMKNAASGFTSNQILLLQDGPSKGAVGNSSNQAAMPDAQPAADENFTYQWREWRYNDFGFEVDAPAEGWLLIRQIDDPLWRVTLDGRPVQVLRANVTGLALALPAGKHYIHMEYQPLARRLYWPASLLLEIALLVLLVISARAPVISETAGRASPTHAPGAGQR